MHTSEFKSQYPKKHFLDDAKLHDYSSSNGSELKIWQNIDTNVSQKEGESSSLKLNRDYAGKTEIQTAKIFKVGSP